MTTIAEIATSLQHKIQYAPHGILHDLKIMPYAKEIVTWRGVTVKLRHPFKNLDTDKKTKTKAAYEFAREILDESEAELRKGVPEPTKLPTATWERIDRYFKTPEHTETTLNRIRGVLTATRTGLSASLGLKVVWLGEGSDTAGYVRGLPNLKQLARFISNIWRWDRSLLIGDIHVAECILDDRPLAATTIIHEATHKFAYTDDFGETGYMKDSTPFVDDPYRKTGLTTTKALKNADSYAYLARSISGET